MKNKWQGMARGFLIVFLLLFMSGCASIPELKVNYQLPPPSDPLKGKRVVLVVEDNRPAGDFLGQGALKEFKNFSGNLSFSVARHGEAGFKLGPYRVSDMIREAFKRKLENLGMKVSSEKTDGLPQLVLVLNTFFLDLKSRRWVAQMSYDGKLLKNGNVVSTQAISGQGERVKVWGTGAADVVMGELVTDMVNRLDVPGLFKQAKGLGS